jgi:tetratricopeptide (TPR) repeat protein
MIPDETAREAALQAIEAQLAREPDAVEPRFRQASLLAALGRAEAARDAYLAVLARHPAHFGALNDLANLLYAGGFRSAARISYAEAVRLHPDNPVGRVNLANLLLAAGEWEEARLHYEHVLRRDPRHAEAHQGLARICAEAGEARAAARHRRLGFAERVLTRLPFRGPGRGIDLLLLVSAQGGDIPTRFLLDDRVFRVTALVADFCDPAAALPAHDLVFNAIGDADLCPNALRHAAALLARTGAPIINPPAQVLATGRLANARRLADIPGLVVPRMARLPRASLDAAQLERRGFALPVLLRSPGFHTGRHFHRVAAAELAAAAGSLPGRDVLAIEYLDARGADGMARKYRAMCVGGALYPLHLAISRDWKVHYFTADMADRPDHRAEEEKFLADMPAVLGPARMAVLEKIRDRLGLDYGGIDFGLREEKLLFFEANATMVVNPPEPDPLWRYRAVAVESVLAAVRAMLATRLAAQG